MTGRFRVVSKMEHGSYILPDNDGVLRPRVPLHHLKLISSSAGHFVATSSSVFMIIVEKDGLTLVLTRNI
jgi:hypothetical protein